jgi:hypothetical protein
MDTVQEFIASGRRHPLEGGEDDCFDQGDLRGVKFGRSIFLDIILNITCTEFQNKTYK